VDLLRLQTDARAAKLEFAGEQLCRRACPGTARGSLDCGEAVKCATNGGVHPKSLPARGGGVTDAAFG
jgi:hypothetical protein